MNKLHDIFANVVQDKIRSVPGKARIIETARTKGRLLAIKGRYDYVEKILPYCYAAQKTIIGNRDALPDLSGYDVIFVGCPGKLESAGWEKSLPVFLNNGGVLLTTDWCLGNLAQKLFPGIIKVAGSASGRFPLRVKKPGHPLLEGIAKCDGTPWIIEGGSHRIGVLDPKRVEVILDAPQMDDPSPILVAFEVGKGLVVHAISHFHLQGSEKKGEYVSAYILTNVIDEAIRRRYPEPTGSRIKVIDKSEKTLPSRIKIL